MLEKFLMSGKENMGYRIKLVDQFLDEFEEICDYISNKLKKYRCFKQVKRKSYI